MKKEVFDGNNFFLPTYKPLEIDIERGEGIYLFDKSGKKYYDFFSGLAVNALGYAHPKIINAVSGQVARFAHLSNYFLTDIQKEFAEKLIKISGMSRLFLTNSGTEAAEAALKLIRKKSGQNKIIFSLSDSFHGRTYGALSITARDKYRQGFYPLLANTSSIKFNDVNDLSGKISPETAAVFLEFIQGEGGINEVSEEFLNTLAQLREKYNFLIVADEIQSGIGRTGKNFAYQHFNFVPDIVLTAKAIGGGLPLGAMLVNQNLENVFSQGDHGTTFGGNPVCCAAGLVVLKEVFENGLLDRVNELGHYFKNELNAIKNRQNKKIKEIRGKGFMLGVELYFDGKTVVEQMLKRNILTNCTNNNVIRILPPLITTSEEIKYFLDNFEEVIVSL